MLLIIYYFEHNNVNIPVHVFKSQNKYAHSTSSKSLILNSHTLLKNTDIHVSTHLYNNYNDSVCFVCILCVANRICIILSFSDVTNKQLSQEKEGGGGGMGLFHIVCQFTEVLFVSYVQVQQ